MDDQPTSQPASNVKLRSVFRPHKRTLIVLLAFVVVPWSLVAVCGTHLGGYGLFWGHEVQRSVHGWPLVHCERLDIADQHYAGASPFEQTKTVEDARKVVRKFALDPQQKQYFLTCDWHEQSFTRISCQLVGPTHGTGRLDNQNQSSSTSPLDGL